MNRHTFKNVLALTLVAISGAAAHASTDAVPVPLADLPPFAARGQAPSGPLELRRLDLRTGQETRVLVSEANGLPEAVRELLQGGGAEELFSALNDRLNNPTANQETGNAGQAPQDAVILDRAFGSRSLVSATSSYPNSSNCRIDMQFQSQCNTTLNYMGSATLIDPKWVLTAGHCVHSSNAPAADPRGACFTARANQWASNFIVSPGYSGGSRPFGTARGIALWTWTGWTNSRDWNQDIAFVELDRHVGAITGWAGYGFNDSSSFFTGNTFNLKGYPAAGGYSGQYMYSRSGNFASRSGNIVKFTPMGLGGESGSSYTRSNIAYAVHSHSYTSINTGGGVALWSGFFYDLRDNRILAGTPSSPDLVPLAVRTSTTSISRGAVIPSIQVLVHNCSRSTFTGSPSISFRFASNDLITTVVPAASNVITAYSSIAPKSSKWITVYNVRVPTTAPVGSTVYLGAILNNVDANTGNNATKADDTDRLAVR